MLRKGDRFIFTDASPPSYWRMPAHGLHHSRTGPESSPMTCRRSMPWHVVRQGRRIVSLDFRPLVRKRHIPVPLLGFRNDGTSVKINLSPFLIVILLSCSACTSVQQAPIVEKSIDTSIDAVTQSPGTAAPKSEAGDASAGTWIALPGADSAPPVTAGSEEDRTAEDSTGISENPAVIALLDETDFKSKQGNADGAINSIERALRLEPKNPWLWHRLAVLRFQRRQWRQAIALAEKSNSLSIRYPELRKANSELIKQARQH